MGFLAKSSFSTRSMNGSAIVGATKFPKLSVPPSGLTTSTAVPKMDDPASPAVYPPLIARLKDLPALKAIFSPYGIGMTMCDLSVIPKKSLNTILCSNI